MANDPINEALTLNQLFVHSERFYLAFYEFEYRLNSLQRLWVSTRLLITRYLTELRAARSDGSWEMEMFKDDLIRSEEEYHPEFLRGAVISHSLALLEILLGDVVKDVSSDLGTFIDLDKRQLPYVNRYVLFLTRTCGLELEIGKDLWGKLDAIRELRNRYMHKLDRDLPSPIKATLARIVDETQSNDKHFDDVVVDLSLKVVADLAGRLESAYWRWFDKRKGLNGA